LCCSLLSFRSGSLLCAEGTRWKDDSRRIPRFRLLKWARGSRSRRNTSSCDTVLDAIRRDGCTTSTRFFRLSSSFSSFLVFPSLLPSFLRQFFALSIISSVPCSNTFAFLERCIGSFASCESCSFLSANMFEKRSRFRVMIWDCERN